MKKIIGFVLALIALPAFAQQPQTSDVSGTQPVFSANAKYVNGVAPGYWPTAGSGLTLNLSAGTANCSGTIATYAAGTLTMTASATNYVYLNTAASCVPAVKTTAFVAADIPIAEVVASGTAITTITDVRTMFFVAGTSSAAGLSVCADTSGSGTAQSCTPSPAFTPTTNSCMIYTTTTANSGTSLTLNVGGIGAKSVAKWQGAITLAAGDVPANKPVVACYDGADWNLSTIGNAPTGGGGSAPSGTGVPQVVSGSYGTTVDMGATANVPLVSNGSHNPVLASGTINTGGTGTSVYSVTTTTIGNLGTLTGLTANASVVMVTDGATCGDTSTGGGSVNETLRYLGSSTWGVIACGPAGSVTANGLFSQVVYTPTTTSTGFTTALNQSTTFTATNNATGITLSETTPQTTNAFEGIVGAYPAAPFTRTFLFGFPQPQSYIWQRIGIIVTNGLTSTASAINCEWGVGNSGVNPIQCYAQTALVNTGETFTQLGSSMTAYVYPSYLWLRYSDDGTNFSLSYSMDGSSFYQIYTGTKAGSILGASGFNYFGIFYNNEAASAGQGATATLLSYH